MIHGPALAVANGCALFSCCAGHGGQLGHGSAEGVKVPQLVRALDGFPIAIVVTGNNTSLALARSGEMWS